MTTSTLGYALLAALARAPSSGYELSQRLEHPIGYFWTAQHSQIHGELRRLTEAALVSFQATPGPGPYAKKIYSVTDAGMRALATWISQPPRPEPSRSEMMLKSYALWVADRPTVTALFETQLAEHRRRLAEYEAAWSNVVGAHPGGVPPRSHPDFGNYVTLRYGIGLERHTIEWCEWLLGH
jgi:DNA-binding PadR family transcriptional regulator